MRAPEFWNHRGGPQAAVLTRLMLEPASWLYQAGASLRASTSRVYAPPAAVFCVGNITLGGAGKTPVAIAVLERMKARGLGAHALTRGYGGRKRKPVLVDPEAHDYRDVGDEALLIARVAPTWVAKSKAAGARAAARAGAEMVVLDDGLQNPTLRKDLALVVIDAAAGLGNGRVFPAGPLRESARAALARADAVVLTSPEEAAEGAQGWRPVLPLATPVLDVTFAPKGAPPVGAIFAFAGLARPQKFFDAVAATGAELVGTATFPDHHPYTEAELNGLRETARRHNALLLTTEKDHVRLPRTLARLVHAWPIAARFADEPALDALIDRALERAATRR